MDPNSDIHNAENNAAEQPAEQQFNVPVNELVSTSSAAHGAHAGTSTAGTGTASAGTNGDEIVYRKRKRKHHKKKHRARLVLIIILVVVVVLIAGVAGAMWYINADMTSFIHGTNDNAQVSTDDNSSDGQTITYKGHKYQLNSDMVSIMFIGHDDSTETSRTRVDDQADMICVVAMNTATGKMTVINVPRDSMVAVDVYGVDSSGNQTNYVGQNTEQLCLAYSYGKGTDAITNVQAATQRILYNIPIAYYIDLDEDGIEPMVDAVDGVFVEALDTIPNTSIVEGQSISLNGALAHKYVQYRDVNVVGSSLNRQARQSQFIKAYISKCMSSASNNIGVVTDLFNQAQQYITTNLDAKALVYFAQCALNNGIDSPEMVTLKGTSQQNDATNYNEYTLDTDNVMQVVVDTYYTQID